MSQKIDEQLFAQYKPLILQYTEYIPRNDELRNYRVEWEILSAFQITEKSIMKLSQKGVPGKILSQLKQALPHQKIIGKREFLGFVADIIGKDKLYQYQSPILVYTKIPIGPEAYFENNGTDLVVTETSSKGMTTATLRQILPKEGQNQIRIRLKLPNKLPAGLDQLCCPKPNDVIAEIIIKKTWVPPRVPVVKHCARKVALGDLTRFDIDFTNESDFDITSVFVTDNIPPGFKYVGASPKEPTLIQQPNGGDVDGTVSWALQQLRAGQSETLRIVVEAAYVGTFTNTVRLTTPHTTRYFEASCTIEVVEPSLKVWKSCPPMATVNQTVPYSYVIKNLGTADVTQVNVLDTVPQGMEIVSASDIATLGSPAEDCPCTYTPDQLTCNCKDNDLLASQIAEGRFTAIPHDSILPGGSAYGGFCQVNGEWRKGHSVTNQIAATALSKAPQQPVTTDASQTQMQPRGLSSAESCNTCILPRPYPALLLEVVDLYDTVQQGETTTYKITVTNQDHAEVNNVNPGGVDSRRIPSQGSPSRALGTLGGGHQADGLPTAQRETLEIIE